MMKMRVWRQRIVRLLPRRVVVLLRRIVGRPEYPLQYVQGGWEEAERLSETSGWNSDLIGSRELEGWSAFVERCKGKGPLGFSHEGALSNGDSDLSFHNIHMTFAYVLARAARSASVKVLDLGGSLGHYYWLARSMYPEWSIDYACKELPGLAALGRRVSEEVTWYDDDSCFQQTYDLVMLSGSLQCVRDWQQVLSQSCRAASGYLFLGRVPVVDDGSAYVTVQKVWGSSMPHWQFDRESLMDVVRDEGFDLVREFVTGDRYAVPDAPSPFEIRSWLFKRRSNQGQ